MLSLSFSLRLLLIYSVAIDPATAALLGFPFPSSCTYLQRSYLLTTAASLAMLFSGAIYSPTTAVLLGYAFPPFSLLLLTIYSGAIYSPTQFSLARLCPITRSARGSRKNLISMAIAPATSRFRIRKFFEASLLSAREAP
jgi:hypothetical protein